MFKELFALAERAPVLVLLTRDGDDKLRVNITRKQDEDEKEVPLSISILATPAELDTELPLALAEGFALNEAEAKTVSVADQVKGQVEAAKSEGDAKPAAKSAKRAARKVVTPKVVKMKPQKKARPAGTPKPVKPRVTRSQAANSKNKAAQSPSHSLAAIIGADPIGYNDAVKKVWAYIKANGLQDKKNKRKITADQKLQTLAAGERLAVENIGKIVRKHLGAQGSTAASAHSAAATGTAVPKTRPLLPGPDEETAPQPPPEVKPLVKPFTDAPEPKPVEPAQPAPEPAKVATPAKETAAAPGEAGDLDLF